MSGTLVGLHVGVPCEFFFEELDVEVQQAVEQAILQQQSLGVHAAEVSWPLIWRAPALDAISLAEGAAAHEPWSRTRAECDSADIRERMWQGLFVPATAYVKAQRIRSVVMRDLARVFQEV